MTTFDTHFTLIQSNATRFPEKLALKIPRLETEDDSTPHQKIIGWTDITYQRLYQDIISSAEYWLRTLQCSRGSVVGLWMLGTAYREIVHLFGLMEAGFIPQILNLKIPSADVATKYFKQSNLEHVLHEPTAQVNSLRDHFQVHELIDLKKISNNQNGDSNESNGLPSLPLIEEKEDDTMVIFHTSGSTSGRPKRVPFTRKWIDGHSRKPLPGLPNGNEVSIAMNGVAHLSQFGIFLRQFKNVACVVTIPWLDLTGAELVQMITECKANILYQLTPIFGNTLREAMTNDELREALRSLNFIGYGGAAFGDNERLWAIENGITLKNMYGSTEMGFTMLSEDDPTILHPMVMPGLVHEFVTTDTVADSEIDFKDTKNRLVESIISPSSLDAPDPSLCTPNGHFHTRDLFEEVEPNGFKYRGRLDDIIMMSKGQKCDTLFIESQILAYCKDLISICVVVGSGKPSPVLLIEPLDEMVDTSLKNEIGKKAGLINRDGFPHERIRPSDILILPSGALPRTPKGNVNRSAAERLFKADIDAFFEQ